jgi:hypothetical protein
MRVERNWDGSSDRSGDRNVGDRRAMGNRVHMSAFIVLPVLLQLLFFLLCGDDDATFLFIGTSRDHTNVVAELHWKVMHGGHQRKRVASVIVIIID